MRNLRKLTAVIIVIALVLTSMTAAFAATTPVNADKAATLKDLGLYAGTDDNDVSAGLDGALTTQDSLVFLAKLFGYKDAADQLTADEVTKALAKFADAKDITEYARNVVAYSAINGILSGSTKDGKFYVGPKDTVTAARFATFMLKQMGYTVPAFTEAVAQIAEVDGSKVSASEAGDLTRDIAVGIMYGALTAEKASGATVIADIVGDDAAKKAIAEKAGLFADDSVLSVTNVTVSSAKSFKVVFNKAVEDTSKIAFEVKRSTNAATLTTTWNEAKTEATLTSATTLVLGDYSVSVKNDTTDLGTTKVTVAQQKLAKIEITSTKLSVVTYTETSNNVTTTKYRGYANYKVFDQYGNDITSTYLANNVQVITGVGNAETRNGIITIDGGSTSLVQYPTVVLNAYDNTSGVSTSATLTTSTALGTLSDFQLGTLSNENNKSLTYGDVTSVFYASYTALDMSGNETTNYKLIKAGLILNGSDQFTTSNPNVTATLVQDPKDSTKAAIEVKTNTNGNNDLTVDMPLIITSMTLTGKTSQISTTLLKSKSVETITLFAPDEAIATGEKDKEIPFEAYDQDGNRVTKFADLFDTSSGNAKVTLTGPISPVENVDGTAKIVFDATGVPANTSQYISASVSRTAKNSSLTITVQKAVEPSDLFIDSSVFVSAMEYNAEQKIDLGDDVGGIKVVDQYDRKIDMVSGNNSYVVKVTANGVTLKDPSGPVTGPAMLTSKDANHKFVKVVAGGTAGSATVRFELFASPTDAAATNSTPIAAKTVSMSVINPNDITDYTIDEVKDAIYANSTAIDNGNLVETTGVPAKLYGLTARERDYTANPKIYGKTSSGTKVVLEGNVVTGAYVSNSDEFAVVTATTTSASLGYDGVKVIAGKLDTGVTASDTILNVVLKHNGKTKSVTTTIKSSTASPVAQSMGVNVDNFVTGLSIDGDTVTVDSALFAANPTGKVISSLSKFAVNGDKTNSPLYIYAKDQYGKKAMKISRYEIDGTATNNLIISIGYDGTVHYTSGTGTVKISAVSNNGLVKTIKLKVE